MRLYELEAPPVYLCSQIELRVGSTAEQSHSCDLGAVHEGALEQCRPKTALPRSTTLRLHAEPDQDAEYVYRVSPIGHMDRFHTSWLIKLASTNVGDIGETNQYATGFWSGEPIPEDREAPWEYRAEKAKVLSRVGGSALHVV